jgi:NADPH2:quinone reductase
VLAVTIQEFGDPDGMVVVEVPAPVAGPGQVVLRVEAIGVGGVDAVIRRGTLGSGYEAGLIPGSEVAGVVTAAGDGVDASWVGRRVWAFTGIGGGYAEQAVARVEDLTVIPEGLSSTDAVTLGSAATVAHFALAHAHFRAGESVLVRGAAGSIGIGVVELAARAGASTVAVTTSSPERGRRLRALGATHVLDRAGSGGAANPGAAVNSGRAVNSGMADLSAAAEPRAADPRAADSGVSDLFDVIIDIVGGPDMPTFLNRLAPNGRLVLVGAVAGFPPASFGMELIRAFQQSRSFATFSLATVPVAERNAMRTSLLQAATRGGLSPVVHAVLPLDQAAEAHRQMDRGSVFGRIVLVPESER